MSHDEVAHAVFSASERRASFGGDKLCVVKYVRLEGGLTRGRAIELLKLELEKRYSEVKFHFWCDGCALSAGSPQILTEATDGSL